MLPLRTRPYFLGHQLLHRSVCGFFSLTSAPKSPVKMAVSFCLDWQLTWHGLYADLVSEHIALPFPVFLIKFLWGEKEKNLRFAEDLLCGQSHKYRCYWVHKTGQGRTPPPAGMEASWKSVSERGLKVKASVPPGKSI